MGERLRRYASRDALEVVTAQPARHGLAECESSLMDEVVVMGRQTMTQAARLAASQARARRRRERAKRDRRLERLAVELLPALGERELHGSDRGRDHGRRNGPAAAVADHRDRTTGRARSASYGSCRCTCRVAGLRRYALGSSLVDCSLSLTSRAATRSKPRRPDSERARIPPGSLRRGGQSESAGCRAHRYRWRPVRLRFRRPELFGDLGWLRSAGPKLDSAVNGGRVPEVERGGDEAGGSRRDSHARNGR
jgi:hypothetical protein